MLGSKQIGYGCSWVPGSDSGRFERVQSDFNGTSGGFVLSLPKENDLLENLDDNLLGSGYSSLESHLIGNSMVHLARDRDSHDHHMKLVGDTEPRFEGIAREVGVGVRSKGRNRGRTSGGKGATFGVGEIGGLECEATTGLVVVLGGSMGPDTSTLEVGDWGAAFTSHGMMGETAEGNVGGEISLELPGRKLRTYELPHQDDPVQEKKRNDAIRAARNRLKKEKEMEDLEAQLAELQTGNDLMREQKIAQLKVNEELERELTRVTHENSSNTSFSFSSPATSHESYSPCLSFSASPTSNHLDVSYSQFSDSSNLYPSTLESSDMYYHSSPPSNMDAHPSHASNMYLQSSQSLDAQFLESSTIYGQSLQSSSYAPYPVHTSSLHSTPLQ